MFERFEPHPAANVVSYLIADDKRNWDKTLLLEVAALKSNVSRDTGLASDEVHIGRYPRLPMTILEGRGVKGHQGLRKDQLDYIELMLDRQLVQSRAGKISINEG